MLLLDTNIVSYVMRGHTFVEPYRADLAGHVLAISFMTVAELLEGAGRSGWGDERRSQLEAVLKSYVVLPFTIDVCRHWAAVRVARRKQPIAVDDAWIAATAVAYDLPLVTHNPNDFRHVPGLRVITRS